MWNRNPQTEIEIEIENLKLILTKIRTQKYLTSLKKKYDLVKLIK